MGAVLLGVIERNALLQVCSGSGTESSEANSGTTSGRVKPYSSSALSSLLSFSSGESSLPNCSSHCRIGLGYPLQPRGNVRCLAQGHRFTIVSAPHLSHHQAGVNPHPHL